MYHMYMYRCIYVHTQPHRSIALTASATLPPECKHSASRQAR